MRSRPPPQVQEARRTPDPHLESQSLSCFQVPAGTAMPGRLGVQRTKGKSGPSRPSYLGSLNGFQIKAEGLPWTHSRKGCLPGNLLAPHHPHPQQREGKSKEQSLAASQQAQSVALFTFPANPGSPSQGTKGHQPPAGTTPKRSRQSPELGSSEQCRNGMAANHLAGLIFCVGLENGGLDRPTSSCPHFHTGHSSKSEASLCQSKYQLSSASLPSI